MNIVGKEIYKTMLRRKIPLIFYKKENFSGIHFVTNKTFVGISYKTGKSGNETLLSKSVFFCDN